MDYVEVILIATCLGLVISGLIGIKHVKAGESLEVLMVMLALSAAPVMLVIHLVK